MKKILLSLLAVLVAGLLLPNTALAHVTVKPGEVAIGTRLNFVVSVPTEEAEPTIGLRLLIPAGVQSVRPNVKPGWEIELKKTGSGEDERVSEIIWSGGQIPAGQRDEFVFSAQAPAQEAKLAWKAYQTYAGGHVVAWDNDPTVVAEYAKNNPPKGGEDDHSAPRPWSETKVIDDLQGESTETGSSAKAQTSGDKNLLYVSIALSLLALIIAGYSLDRRSS